MLRVRKKVVCAFFLNAKTPKFNNSYIDKVTSKAIFNLKKNWPLFLDDRDVFRLGRDVDSLFLPLTCGTITSFF